MGNLNGAAIPGQSKAIAYRRHQRYHVQLTVNSGTAVRYSAGSSMGNVIKKRRKKMSKHKYRKMLKKTRWQRRHK